MKIKNKRINPHTKSIYIEKEFLKKGNFILNVRLFHVFRIHMSNYFKMYPYVGMMVVGLLLCLVGGETQGRVNYRWGGGGGGFD